MSEIRRVTRLLLTGVLLMALYVAAFQFVLEPLLRAKGF